MIGLLPGSELMCSCARQLSLTLVLGSDAIMFPISCDEDAATARRSALRDAESAGVALVWMAPADRSANRRKAGQPRGRRW